ncbi:MAG: hypothetical protein KIS78_23785 [Labilithrix sp.]|nr:hypothetical protein [Labilithrix sp.]
MRKLAFAALAALVAAACSSSSEPDADGKGAVTFTTWGEEFIEQEIPPKDEDGEVIVEDGWTIKFTKFLVVISEVNVGEDGKEPAAKLATPKLFDMHAPGPKPVVAFADLPGKAYTHVSYAIAPEAAAAELGGGATDADKQLMVQNGYSVYVEGSVIKDATTKSFAWGFSTNTLYDRCKAEVSGKETDGVVVTNGGNDAVELTIHGDHFFYDDLQAADAKVRVDNIANADADADGEVTLEELAAVELADTTKITAGTYGTGSASNINDLRAFVEALSRTLGHFRGEGECTARAR